MHELTVEARLDPRVVNVEFAVDYVAVVMVFLRALQLPTPNTPTSPPMFRTLLLPGAGTIGPFESQNQGI